MGLAGFALLLVLRPDILDRPSVAHLMTAANPEKVDNFQWRREQRWPHFLKIAADNFWFGVGTDVDASLGNDERECLTPHNGYLSAAVIHGTPALLFRVVLLLLAIRAGFALARSATTRRARTLGLAVGCALVGTLVHNHVEATIELAEVARSLWLLSAVVCGPVLWRAASRVSDAPARLALVS
jgi:O-antigen ligase